MKKMLFLFDTQWCMVKGSIYQTIQINKIDKINLTKRFLREHFSRIDKKYVKKANDYVKKHKKDYFNVTTSFNVFDCDLETGECIFYQKNPLEMLPFIKNKKEIESFIDVNLIDYLNYEYNQMENKTLFDILLQVDIIDMLSTSMDGCINEGRNLRELEKRLNKKFVLNVLSKFCDFDYGVRKEQQIKLKEFEINLI